MWAKSNNRTRSQFECDVAWVWFYFDFVCSHAECGCCSIVFQRGWSMDSVKLDVQGQRGGNILDVNGYGALKIFMDVISVSTILSLSSL